MADVAERAGVSITTVSHVINRSRPVSAQTTSRVLDAATAVGYLPDDLFRAMRTQGGKTVGLAMSAITNTYFGSVVHGVEQTLARAGYSLLLADTHDEAATELQAVAHLLRKRVDAIILAPAGDAAKILAYTKQHNVPLAVIDRSVAADVDQVSAESREPTAQLVDHLAELGHRRIALIGGRAGLTTTLEREDGYRTGLKRNTLRYQSGLQVGGDSTADGAAAALDRLMRLDNPPTAVIAANNNMTIGVLREAKALGLAIPTDLAFACFDDFEWADLFRPGLTAIAQPTNAIGAQAADLIISRLADPDLPIRRVQLKSILMHRQSCGCPDDSQPQRHTSRPRGLAAAQAKHTTGE